MLPKAAMPGYRLPRVAYGRYILSERGAERAEERMRLLRARYDVEVERR